ncbi:MAG: response regulator transcription factor [Candidatus Eisenbacteria bacterium]|uniref:Response regulator transcription factor n=1 Tax=Eiseniibacteriota bacterium TaxID=2212470 RepID=A0A7Y2E6F4_UNCEI|nr:response regulator transcription factor [Candidatus Eisenbacteria bacterium]
MARTVILVIEDDAAIRRGLCDALDFNGYRVLECDRGDRGLETALDASPDLVLLDVLLPGMEGFEVLTELRKARPRLPVIMLTARGTEEDRVRGLKGGADDYVVKPFSASELLARVEAVLRRSAERPTDVRSLAFADRTVDFERLEITLSDGTKLRISDLEANIIRYLAVNCGRPIDRQEMLQHVWDGNTRELETRTVDMHIRRLREKLERDPTSPERIITVRSKGYMFAEGTL